MINFNELLGICEYDIEETEKRIRETFEELGLEMPEDLAERAMNLMEGSKISRNMQDEYIDCMLQAATEALETKVRPLIPTIETYCNGADSRFSLPNEGDKNVIRACMSNPTLDTEFVEWLECELCSTGDRDLMEVVKNDVLCDALNELRGKGGSLLLSTQKYSEEEIMAKEQECLDNPSDVKKIFFRSVDGNIWMSSVTGS